MFCVNCGSYEPSGSAYCTRCGFRLDTVGAAPADTPYRASSGPNAPTTAFSPGGSVHPTATAVGSSEPMRVPRGNAYAGAYSRVRRRRRHGCAVGCLATLLLLIVFVLATWSLLLQPALRGIADNALRTRLAQMAAQVPTLPSVPAARVTGWQLTIHPGDINQALDQTLRPIVQANTSFTSGQALVTFHALGLASTVSAAPTVRDGYLLLHNVQVTGPLSWVLPGQTIQADFNQALVSLMAREHLQATALTTTPSQLVVSFKSAGA